MLTKLDLMDKGTNALDVSSVSFLNSLWCMFSFNYRLYCKWLLTEHSHTLVLDFRTLLYLKLTSKYLDFVVLHQTSAIVNYEKTLLCF